MTKDEALKLALEALKMADELCVGHGVDFKEYGLEFDRDIQVKYKDAITAIKEALAQPEQEPVAWCVYCDGQFNLNIFQVKDAADCEKLRLDLKYPNSKRQVVPLYTTPPKRPWVGLTDEEISQLWISTSPYFNEDDFAKAVETKLKEKNT